MKPQLYDKEKVNPDSVCLASDLPVKYTGYGWIENTWTGERFEEKDWWYLINKKTEVRRHFTEKCGRCNGLGIYYDWRHRMNDCWSCDSFGIVDCERLCVIGDNVFKWMEMDVFWENASNARKGFGEHTAVTHNHRVLIKGWWRIPDTPLWSKYHNGVPVILGDGEYAVVLWNEKPEGPWCETLTLTWACYPKGYWFDPYKVRKFFEVFDHVPYVDLGKKVRISR